MGSPLGRSRSAREYSRLVQACALVALGYVLRCLGSVLLWAVSWREGFIVRAVFVALWSVGTYTLALCAGCHPPGWAVAIYSISTLVTTLLWHGRRAKHRLQNGP